MFGHAQSQRSETLAAVIPGSAARPRNDGTASRDFMTRFRAYTPAVATILTDDDRTRVTRWDFEPGAETGHHTHGLAYVVVPVTDMKVRIADKDGEREVFVPAGAAYSRPAGIEHNVINADVKPMCFVEVEMKR